MAFFFLTKKRYWKNRAISIQPYTLLSPQNCAYSQSSIPEFHSKSWSFLLVLFTAPGRFWVVDPEYTVSLYMHEIYLSPTQDSIFHNFSHCRMPLIPCLPKFPSDSTWRSLSLDMQGDPTTLIILLTLKIYAQNPFTLRGAWTRLCETERITLSH